MQTTLKQAAPAAAIWNPDAAANWSLLFTPAFGAYLHMRNWQALGEPALAASARRWWYASLALLGLNLFASALAARLAAEPGVMRVVGALFFLAWYFLSARRQSKAVRARYAPGYPRKGWDQAVLAALLAALAYWTLCGGLIVAFLTLT
jgi:hypothetical protein